MTLSIINRKTLAAEHGWYFLLSDLFAADNISDLDLDKYNSSHLKLYDIFEQIGHNKSDLIVR
jgi:hypothetical protein